MVDGSRMALVACLSVLVLQQCAAFFQPHALLSTTLRCSRHGSASSPSQTHVARHRTAVSAREGALRLRMAKKSGGSKRKKKKAAAAGAGGGTAVTEKSSSPSTSPTSPTSSAGDGFQDAGSTMMGGAGGGPRPIPEVKMAKRGEVLEDGVIGTDEAREAKIEETLRKMGVQSIGEVRAEKAKAMEEEKNRKSMEQQITSIFELIPSETQLLMERVFIAGFALCLVFLVFCGCAIGVEAYFLSTQGKLPPDLDDFIVQKLEPLFTPSLGLTFFFSSCLGVLKLGQMGQESVVYREDD